MLGRLWSLLGFGRSPDEGMAAGARDETPRVPNTNDASTAAVYPVPTNATGADLRLARMAIVEEGDLDTTHAALTLWIDSESDGDVSQEGLQRKSIQEVEALSAVFLVEAGDSKRRVEVAFLAGVILSRIAGSLSFTDSAVLRNACLSNLAQVGKPLAEVQLMAYSVLWWMLSAQLQLRKDVYLCIQVFTAVFERYPELKRAPGSNAARQSEIFSEGLLTLVFHPDTRQRAYADHRLLSAYQRALPWLPYSPEDPWEENILIKLVRDVGLSERRDLLLCGLVGRLASLMEQRSIRNWAERNPPLQILGYLYVYPHVPLTRLEKLILKDAEPWSVLDSVLSERGESASNKQVARALTRFHRTPDTRFVGDAFVWNAPLSPTWNGSQVVSEGGEDWPRITIHNSLWTHFPTIPPRICPRFEAIAN